MYHIITTLYISLILFLSLKPFISIKRFFPYKKEISQTKSFMTQNKYQGKNHERLTAKHSPKGTFNYIF